MKRILSDRFKKDYVFYILSFLIIASVFGQVCHFDYSLDDQLINQDIPGRTEGIKGILHLFGERYNKSDYRPFVTTSYAIEKYVAGENNPHVSHCINLILYFLIAIALYKTSTGLFRNDKQKLIVSVAILLFLVHPVHAEVIAGLKSRDNLLSMLFGILSGNYLFKYSLIKKQWQYFFAGILFFLIAIFSKVDAAGLILFIPLSICIINKEKKGIALFYFLLLLFIVLLIRYALIDYLIPVKSLFLKPSTTFTENPLSGNFTIGNRISAAAVTLWYYVKLLVIPTDYRYYYGYNYIPFYTTREWQSITAIIAGIGLFSVIIRYFWRDKIIQICLGGFISFILYALNFITPVAGIIADRYIFISSLFFCAAAVYFIYKLINNEQKFIVVSAVIIIIFGIISFCRTSAWENKLTLVERDAPELGTSYEAMRIAAATYIEFADKETNPVTKSELLNKAIDCAEKGNAVYPVNVLLHKLEATAYFKKNEYGKAKELFHIAIKNDSAEYETLNFLGDIFYMEKNLDSAYYYYNKAFAFDISDPTLISNISSILFEKGEKKACVDFNLELLDKNQSLYAAWENLGYYYLQESDTATAINYFENGYQHGLKNRDAAQLIINYLERNSLETKAKSFAKYAK